MSPFSVSLIKSHSSILIKKSDKNNVFVDFSLKGVMLENGRILAINWPSSLTLKVNWSTVESRSVLSYLQKVSFDSMLPLKFTQIQLPSEIISITLLSPNLQNMSYEGTKMCTHIYLSRA